MKRALIIGAIILILLFIIGIGSNDNPKSTSEKSESPQEMTETIEPEKSNWIYSEKKDEMDGSITKFAEVSSTNSLDFKFPYNGGSYGILTIRNKKGKNEIILSISKGQFMSGMFNDLRIKFNDEPPVKFGYSDPASASADMLFINNPDKLIEKLKKSTKVKIEATFYDEGNGILEFNVKDLKW